MKNPTIKFNKAEKKFLFNVSTMLANGKDYDWICSTFNKRFNFGFSVDQFKQILNEVTK